MTDLTELGYNVCRSFEGRALKAYRCPAGVWTIGFGNTNNDKFAVEYLGRPIGPGLEITEEQAEYLLRETMRRNYMPAVARAMPNAKPNETDAGGSFHYNTGAIGRASWVAAWRSKQMAAVRSGLLSWTKGGGRVLSGLVRRREREWAMISRGDYGPEGRTKPPILNANGRVVSDVSKKEHPLNGTPGMLQHGDSGPEVRDLQEALSRIGFPIAVSGSFDDATKKAVESFQTAHKQLRVDGIAGPATRAAVTREADAKRQLKVSTSSTAGPASITTAVDQASGGYLPMWAYVVIGVIVVGVIGYVGWKYRDEIIAMLRRK